MSRMIYPSVEAKCTLGASSLRHQKFTIFGFREWETFSLWPTFEVCRIHRVPLFSALTKILSVDCALSIIWKICSNGQTQNKNILSIFTTLDWQASRTQDRSRDLCLSWVELNEHFQSTVWPFYYYLFFLFYWNGNSIQRYIKQKGKKYKKNTEKLTLLTMIELQ